tara:strand:+ start:260 stop:496 length:237 start_codon:yes stop_codon:yes gene_type:complete
MANFTIAKLTTAVSDNLVMDALNRVGLTTASNWTTSNGTMTVGRSNNFGNFNELDRKTESYNDDKRPRQGIMYPRGGQ